PHSLRRPEGRADLEPQVCGRLLQGAGPREDLYGGSGRRRLGGAVHHRRRLRLRGHAAKPGRKRLSQGRGIRVVHFSIVVRAKGDEAVSTQWWFSPLVPYSRFLEL